MHGFPDRSSLSIVGGNGRQNLRRTALPGFRNIQRLLLAPDLMAQSLLINRHAAQPVIGFAVIRNRIHAYRQVGQACAVALIDGFLLFNMLFQIRELPPDHAGYNIAHPVIVTELFMLVPCGIFAALCGPFPHFVRVFLRVRKEHSS